MKFFLGLCLLFSVALSASASSVPFVSKCRSCECKCRRARRLRNQSSASPSPYPMEEDDKNMSPPESVPDPDNQPDDSNPGYPSGQGSCVSCSKENMDYVNKYRMSMGMGSLHWDGKLASWADEQSRTMFMQERLFHSDHGLWENVAYSGYPTWSNAGESFFEQWRESPGHNRNMLVDTHKCMGTGIYGDGHMFYATQIFSHEC